ncbi:Uncharacterized protein HZ326_20041 [Fusarium oxysporum f. sp. albedinis]|nr:Uncharacterized protein HZ326_20041 [Fusarium oxysporum f. sp. albedinis]
MMRTRFRSDALELSKLSLSNVTEDSSNDVVRGTPERKELALASKHHLELERKGIFLLQHKTVDSERGTSSLALTLQTNYSLLSISKLSTILRYRPSPGLRTRSASGTMALEIASQNVSCQCCRSERRDHRAGAEEDDRSSRTKRRWVDG